MRETITIQVGQCGNQVANSFFTELTKESGLLLDGTLSTNSPSEYPLTSYFTQINSTKFTPRTLLVDTEDRVISNIFQSNLYCKDSILTHPNGLGSGNNWAQGFQNGRELKTQLLDLINRELENADNPESFNLIHGVAGGTGSGLGSYIIELIREFYPKKLLTTLSVFPNIHTSSDTVVQPYNSVLTLKRILETDMPVFVDNTSLDLLTRNRFSSEINLDNMNFLLASTLLNITSLIRKPTFCFSDHQSIIGSLCLGDLNIVVPSVCIKDFREYQVKELFSKLYNKKYKLIQTNSLDTVVSGLNVFNNRSLSDVFECSLPFQEKVAFVPWIPPTFNSVVNKIDSPLDAISLINSTGIVGLLERTLGDFDKLKSRGAFIEMYKGFDTDLSEFDISRNKVQAVVEEYKRAEKADYYRSVI
ncbi:Tubulin gamma chain [Cucumispora dikerogammari]|nr:Tubulin gamma chain [Cucumispora dikerogammari]